MIKLAIVKIRRGVLQRAAAYRATLDPERTRQYMKKWYAEHKNEVIEKSRVWIEKNKDRYVARGKRYREQNSDLVKARQAQWRLKNRDAVLEKKRADNKRRREANPEKFRERSRLYLLRFPEKHAARQAARRCKKVEATPAWANTFFIEEIYDLAKRRTKLTGVEWHVDHIVPLKSRLVCGLHVESNLQVIPSVLNISKSNRMWPDMPTEHAVEQAA